MPQSRRALLVWLVGLIMATPFAGACAQRDPRLKAPSDYFADAQSVALLQAALAGDLAKAKELVAGGANPNDEGPMKPSDATRLRLLHYAIADNSARGVQTLIASGSDPELVAQHNGHAFAFAIKIGKPEMLAMLLELRPINALTKGTVKDLIFGALNWHCQACLEVALKNGVSIDTPDGAGYTPMMDAMSGEDFAMVEWLLKAGASVNVESKNGVTPAYQLERMMSRYRPDTPSYAQLQRIKDLMIAKGAVFPVPTPAEVKARRVAGTK